MNKTIKVVHIHSDLKFISNENIFENISFQNTSIILRKPSQKTFSSENQHWLEESKENIETILNICFDADLIVLYHLDLFKCKLVKEFPSSTILAWRFFGVELYGKNSFSYLSRKTYEVQYNIYHKFKLIVKNIIPSRVMRKFNSNNRLFFSAVDRINLMLIVSEEEYNHLTNVWSNLPKMLKLPHSFESELDLIPISRESNKTSITIGNSRGVFNNHIDIIDIIKEIAPKDNKYHFSFLFNYGDESTYSKEVIRKVKCEQNCTLIEEFIPKVEFLDFYSCQDALVINSYRQLAWDNIRLALRYGTKVYLNDKNAHKSFLINNGIKIYSIDQFINDLKENNLKRNPISIEKSIEEYRRFCQTYSIKDFQISLINEIINIETEQI